MKALKDLLDRIVQGVNVNLREFDYDVGPFIKDLIPLSQMVKFQAFYGITPHHPLNFEFCGLEVPLLRPFHHIPSIPLLFSLSYQV